MGSYFQKISRNEDQSFSFQIEMGLTLHQQRHYHKEHELLYIIRGSGTLIVGDVVRNFKIEDIFFIGCNVPHMMRFDKPSIHDIPEGEIAAIHILPEALQSFVDMPENRLIANLFKKAHRGLSLKGETAINLKKLLNSIRYARDTERIIILLQILSIIARSDNNELNSQNTFKSLVNKSNDNRLNRIYHYTLNNFSREITLKEVADLIHLCPNSFCRYFKSRTKKRYSYFLIEVRINHACKLLIETEYSVSVVSYESGYMNLSNFNRHFKIFKGKTPLEYRKQYYLN